MILKVLTTKVVSMDNISLEQTYLLTVGDEEVKICLYQSNNDDDTDIWLEVEDSPKATIEQVT